MSYGKKPTSHWSDARAKREQAPKGEDPLKLIKERQAQRERMLAASAKLGNDKPKVLRPVRRHS